MQTRAIAATVLCVLLLSGAAVAVPAADGDTDTADTSSAGLLQDILGRTGDGGFVLEADGSDIIELMKNTGGWMPPGTDLDLSDVQEYLLSTGSPTLAGVLTAATDGIWTDASAGLLAAVHVSSEKDGDGIRIAAKASATLTFAVSGSPDGDDARCTMDASGTVSFRASAAAYVASGLVLKTVSVSADAAIAVDGTRNFDIDEDGDVVYTGTTAPLTYHRSLYADAHAELDGVPIASIMEDDDVSFTGTAVARAYDGSGALVGAEARGDLASAFDGLDIGIDDDLFRLLPSNGTPTTGSDDDGADVMIAMARALVESVFGDTLSYYYDLGDESYAYPAGTDVRSKVVSAVGDAPSRTVSPTPGISGTYAMSYWKDATDSVVYVDFEGDGKAPSEIMGYPAAAVDLHDDDDGYSAVLPDGSRIEYHTEGTADGHRTVTTVYRADGTVSGRTTVETTVSADGTVTVTKRTESFDGRGEPSGSSSEVSVTVGSVVDAAALEAAISASGSQGVVVVTSGGSGGTAVLITGDAFRAAAAGGVDLRIDGEAGSVRLPPSSFGSDVSLTISAADVSSMTDAQRRAADGKSVYSISAASGGSSIHELGTEVTVSLPCGPSGGSVYYIDGEGVLHGIESSFDADAQRLVFATDHFSYFAVGEPEGASDDGTSWAAVLVVFAALIVIVAAIIVLRRRNAASRP